MDIETGIPSFDISMILTRHNTFPGSECVRVLELRRTSLHNILNRADPIPARQRLANALGINCSCGIGDDRIEQTTLEKEAKQAGKEAPHATPLHGATLPTGDGTSAH